MSKEVIGPQIKRIRKSRNMTQDDLAKILGYSHKSVITHIEKGDVDMTYEKMALLLKELCLDANDLFAPQKMNNQMRDYVMDERRDKKVVVYIHGLKGSDREIKDYSFLGERYDLKGLVYKDGKPWKLKNSLNYKFKDMTDGYKEIVVIANSIGAFYAIQYLSGFYNIKKAFFISPILDMAYTTLLLLEKEKLSLTVLENKKEIDLGKGKAFNYDFYMDMVHNYDFWDVPTYILYGSNDELTPLDSVVRFLQRHPNAMLTILNGAHHYIHSGEEKKFIKNWILKNI